MVNDLDELPIFLAIVTVVEGPVDGNNTPTLVSLKLQEYCGLSMASYRVSPTPFHVYSSRAGLLPEALTTIPDTHGRFVESTVISNWTDPYSFCPAS